MKVAFVLTLVHPRTPIRTRQKRIANFAAMGDDAMGDDELREFGDADSVGDDQMANDRMGALDAWDDRRRYYRLQKDRFR